MVLPDEERGVHALSASSACPRRAPHSGCWQRCQPRAQGSGRRPLPPLILVVVTGNIKAILEEKGKKKYKTEQTLQRVQ